MKCFVIGVIVSFAVSLTAFRDYPDVQRKEKLSEYDFFKGKLSDLIPQDKLTPYGVNTALFSNYAEKIRFINLPANTAATYSDSVSFDFPIGTILIKNFLFPNDFRKPEKGRRIMETRLLVRLEKGWEAWPYIWNDEQTEAFYDPAGETKQITYVDRSGKKISTQYVIPNKNQCKGCHIRNGKMEPIGTTARQLNGDFLYPSGKQNQVTHLARVGLLNSVPSTSMPQLARALDPNSGSLNERARSYLDANCAHCHSPQGPASTSGLFLNISERDKGHLGVNKSPVAAGRGAGDLQFDIVPGEPQHSILLFRMKTNDPAIAMPEIGREQIDKEGVALIEAWIKSDKF